MREFWNFSEVSYDGHMLVSLTIYILAWGEMTTRNKKNIEKKAPKKFSSFVLFFEDTRY